MGTLLDTKTASSAASTGVASGDDGLVDPLVDPLGDARTAAGTVLGKRTWDDALGSFIGGGLYGALAPHLTEAKLTGYAQQAVNAAVGQLASFLKGQVDPDDAAVAKKFTDLLETELGKQAKALMASDGGGFAEVIGGAVDKNPWLVVLAALAGAATFVLTNQPIPEIPLSGEVGGLKGSVKAKLKGGTLDLLKTFDVALQSLEATLAWKDDLKASYSYDASQKDGKTTELHKGSLDYKNGGLTTSLYGEHKLLDGVGGGTKLGLRGAYEDGPLALSGGVEHTTGMLGVDPMTALSLGGRYKTDDLSLGGSAMFGSDGRYKLSGDYSQKFTDHLSGNASLSHQRMPGASGAMESSTAAKLGLDYKNGNFKAGGFLGVDHTGGKTSGSAGLSLGYSF